MNVFFLFNRIVTLHDVAHSNDVHVGIKQMYRSDLFLSQVRELQTRLQSLEASSPHNSRTSTPTKSQVINPTTGER